MDSPPPHWSDRYNTRIPAAKRHSSTICFFFVPAIFPLPGCITVHQPEVPAKTVSILYKNPFGLRILRFRISEIIAQSKFLSPVKRKLQKWSSWKESPKGHNNATAISCFAARKPGIIFPARSKCQGLFPTAESSHFFHATNRSGTIPKANAKSFCFCPFDCLPTEYTHNL